MVEQIGRSILTPIGQLSPNLELALALFITPLIINIIWFWCVDNFLMSAETKHLQKITYRKSQGGRSSSTGSRSHIGLEERLVDSVNDFFALYAIGFLCVTSGRVRWGMRFGRALVKAGRLPAFVFTCMSRKTRLDKL